MDLSRRAVVLRVLSIISFAIAAIVMFLSKQDKTIQESCFAARYHDWSGFVYSVVVTCIAGCYNLVVFAVPPGSPLWKTVVVLDVLMSILVGTSLGTGWQAYALMKQGNAYVAWFPICGTVRFFCNKVLGSLITSTFGWVASCLLVILSLHYSVDPFLADGC